jgi:hypothetical protein
MIFPLSGYSPSDIPASLSKPARTANIRGGKIENNRGHGAWTMHLRRPRERDPARRAWIASSINGKATMKTLRGVYEHEYLS